MQKTLALSFFLILAAAFLALGDFVVSAAFILTFGITGAVQILMLDVVLGILTASFIIASIIGSRWYTRFTRCYYWLSSVWLGLFLYLFIASVFIIVGTALFEPVIRIGPAVFCIALAASIYGVVHARKIVTTTLSVSLPHLPPAWRGRRAVWISDVHLGQIHGFKYAQKIVAQIRALAPDIIFVGGDLYDGTGAPDIAELTAPLKELSAPLGVYFITGNHEEYGDRQLFLSAVESAGMRVLMDELVTVDGLQIIGVDYQNASDPARFSNTLAKLAISHDRASLLLKHEPNHLAIAEKAGISFQISGHTHRAQMAPLRFTAEWIYRGYAYGLKPFGALQVYTSSGAGTWGPPLRVGTDSEIVVVTFGYAPA